MNNKYSMWILTWIIVLILGGLAMLLSQKLLGLVPLVIGGLLCLGFKELGASPVQIGIITVFGKKVPILVKGLTLVLDWLPIEVIGVVIIDGTVVDEPFDGISIFCADGVVVTGKVVVTYVPDYEDDPPSITPRLSAGDKMILFDQNDRQDGARRQLEGMVNDHMQAMFRKGGHGVGTIGEDGKASKGGHGYEWAITNLGKLTASLIDRLEGKEHDGMSALGNTRSMGINILKINPTLTAPTDIVKAQQKSVIEDLQRTSEGKNFVTYAEHVTKVKEAYPTLRDDQIAAIIDDQLTLEAGVRRVIQGGNLVTFSEAK